MVKELSLVMHSMQVFLFLQIMQSLEQFMHLKEKASKNCISGHLKGSHIPVLLFSMKLKSHLLHMGIVSLEVLLVQTEQDKQLS